LIETEARRSFVRKWFSGTTGMVATFLVGAVVASAATAGAARLITGKQIKDGTISAKDLSKAVRAQLKKAGTPGSQGIPGPQGPAGTDGAQGPPGPFADTLPSGKTLKGAVFLTSAITSYSFAFSLPSAPVVRVRAAGSSATPDCPGSVADPQAARGNLCVYQAGNSPVSVCVFASDDLLSTCTSATRYGFSGSSSGQFSGQWAVTAP
jgi:hypothetical protein